MAKVSVKMNGVKEPLGLYYIDDNEIAGIDGIKTIRGKHYLLEVSNESEIPSSFEPINNIEINANKMNNKNTVEGHMKMLQQKYIEIKNAIDSSIDESYNGFDLKEVDEIAKGLKNKRSEIKAAEINTLISDFGKLIEDEQLFWGTANAAMRSNTGGTEIPTKIHKSTSLEDVEQYSKRLTLYKRLISNYNEISRIPQIEEKIEEMLEAKYDSKRRKNDLTVTKQSEDGTTISETLKAENFKDYINRLIKDKKIKVPGYDNVPNSYNKLDYIDFLDSLYCIAREGQDTGRSGSEGAPTGRSGSEGAPTGRSGSEGAPTTTATTKYTWYGAKTIDGKGHVGRAWSNPFKKRNPDDMEIKVNDPVVVSAWKALKKSGYSCSKEDVAKNLAKYTSVLTTHSRDFIVEDDELKVRSALTPKKASWYDHLPEWMTGMSTQRRMDMQKMYNAGVKIMYGKFGKNEEGKIEAVAKIPRVNKNLKYKYNVENGQIVVNEGTSTNEKEEKGKGER